MISQVSRTCPHLGMWATFILHFYFAWSFHVTYGVGANVGALSTQNNWCVHLSTSGTFVLNNDCPVNAPPDGTVSAIVLRKGSNLDISGSSQDQGQLVRIYCMSTGHFRLFHVENGALTIRYLRLESCVVPGVREGGGAAYVSGAAASLRIYRSRLTQHRAEGNGGAILVNTGSFRSIESLIDNNTALVGGGGVFCKGRQCNCVFVMTTVWNNRAEDDGGGIMCYDGARCDILDGSAVTGNMAPGKAPGVSCKYARSYNSILWGNCSTDGASFISPPCLPGKFGKNAYHILMNESNWFTQPSSEGKNTCSNCPKGKVGTGMVNGLTLAQACKNCRPGSFSAGVGSPGPCIACPAGKHAPMEGAAVCSACTVGQFSPVAGASSCKSCGRGKITPKDGMTRCTACKDDCVGRGVCDTSMGGCRCLHDGSRAPNGWNGLECTTCTPPWVLSASGDCVVCPKGYEIWATVKMEYECSMACAWGTTRSRKTGLCEENWFTIFIAWVGRILSIVSALVVLYKCYVFYILKREGKLDPSMSMIRAFLMVFTYGKVGYHVVDCKESNDTEHEFTELGDDDLTAQVPKDSVELTSSTAASPG